MTTSPISKEPGKRKNGPSWFRKLICVLDSLAGRLTLIIAGLVIFMTVSSLAIERYQFSLLFDTGSRVQPARRMPTILVTIESRDAADFKKLIEGFSHPIGQFRFQDSPAMDPKDIRLPESEAHARQIIERAGITDFDYILVKRRHFIETKGNKALTGEQPKKDKIPRQPGDAARQNWVFPTIQPRQEGKAGYYSTVYVHSFRSPELGGKWINSYNITPKPKLAAFWPSLVLAFLVLVVASTVAIWSARRIIRPIRNLANSAEALGRGEDVELQPVTGPNDIRVLVESFNRMNTRLNINRRSQTALIHSLSHDVKGPIMSAQMVADGIQDDAKREQLNAQLDKAMNVTSAITTLADQSRAEGAMVQADLRSLLEMLVDDFRNLGHEVAFEYSVEPTIPCRLAAMERVFGNLIENAVRHAGSASVNLKRIRNGLVEVVIEDEGPGIPGESLEYVQEPFKKLDPEGTGSGLGLAIVKAILAEAGASIEFENKKPNGLRVRVRLHE